MARKKKSNSHTHIVRNKIVKFLSARQGKRYTTKAIIKKLNTKGRKDIVFKALTQLKQEGKITAYKDGHYGIPRGRSLDVADMQVVRGIVDKIRSGAAYIICENYDSDVYVPAKRLKGALNNDVVDIRITRQRRSYKDEGEVIRIVERAINEIVARIYTLSNRAYAAPVYETGIQELIIERKDLNGAEEGDFVLLVIKEWPRQANRVPIAKVLEILTKFERHEMEEISILTKHGFKYKFPHTVKDELRTIEKNGVSWEENERRDIRSLVTFTIDPADAKDFDDALSIEFLENSHKRIGVHIADVTHYLKPDTALDAEAYMRSTSVYLVGQVCPMLPEVLSNNLCSLVPGQDRLTFSAMMTLDDKDKLIKVWFGKTVIHSNKRFSYEEAQDVLDAGAGEFVDELNELLRISRILRKEREQRGAINFDSEEIRFLLDEKKHPTDIYVKERKDTHLLVEDFMLLANQQVATFLAKQNGGQIPSVYRIHDEPDLAKIADLALMAKMLGFSFETENIKTIRRSFNRLHVAAQKNEAFDILQSLGIRTMAKAEYAVENIGHFGLAFTYYTHFTSPIRRYADVLVHRVLFDYLEHKEFRIAKEKLSARCKHISRKERFAMKAERESIKLKQAEYMQQYVGQIFDGRIISIVSSGMFVSLAENIAEGLITFDSFEEAFDIHPARFSATGFTSGTVFALGDRIRVLVTEVDIEERQVYLDLAI
jgi:ribonuclease R